MKRLKRFVFEGTETSICETFCISLGVARITSEFLLGIHPGNFPRTRSEGLPRKPSSVLQRNPSNDFGRIIRKNTYVEFC